MGEKGKAIKGNQTLRINSIKFRREINWGWRDGTAYKALALHAAYPDSIPASYVVP